MKLSTEQILLNRPLNIKKSVYLLFGPEESLIRKKTNIIINNFKSEGFIQVERLAGKILDFNTDIENDPSLFYDKKIYIYNNPKKINLKFIEGLNLDQGIYIIIDSKIKSYSPIKKSFDAHNNFYSISCYGISDDIKKKILDQFINTKKIQLSKDAYWYFLENSSNDYYQLENELVKIENYYDEEIVIKKMRMLLSQNTNEDIDALFFSILKNKSNVLLISRSTITSSTKAYSFLHRIIFYVDILAKSNNIKELEINFPKYLFKEREKFKDVFKKLNKNKIVSIYQLLKKTEFLMRKNTGMHLIILQRFLLNLKKQLV